MKKSAVLNGMGCSWNVWKMTQEVGSQKRKRTYANVDRVQTLLYSNWRIRARLIAEEYSMDKETAWQIITDDLGMRKISV
jgi:hypothetical protein